MNKQELIEHIGNTLDKYLKNTTFVKPVLSITEIAKSDEVSLEFKIGKSCILLDDVSYQFGYDKGKLDGEWVGQQLKDADKIRQELNKPVVPQFVAVLIEEARTYEWDLDDLFEHISEYSGDSEVSIWFYTLGNVDVLARAWLDGYEVEKEKRYRVKAKGVYFNSCLVFDKGNKKWFFSSIYEIDHQREHHTRKELEEAGFGDVFTSTLFEVEEVEE